ncbi:OmpA family protein [Niveibacterium sp. SC-1]|uniref:OmpA family protein n=1 Tax=Niveibacterium sp. SC-1 TaxID=3135646 RepID=UPI0031203C64
MMNARLAAVLALAFSLLAFAGCSTPTTNGSRADPAAAQSAPAATPPAPVQPQPFEEAVARAADTLFSGVPLAQAERRIVLIDPLVDGMTGEQSVATRGMEARIARLVIERYPRFEVRAFTVENLRKNPLILVGTFTGVNNAGKTEGVREAYRICLALADLDRRVLVSKGTARAQPEGVDLTPLPYFRDSPAWALDTVTEGYIQTCQGSKPGDPMNATYLARVISAVSVQQAINAYNAGRYREALEHYSTAMRAAAGDEIRILNGVYLANAKLGQKAAARLVFQRIVDFGLDRKRMAVKFLFKPGGTAFDPKAGVVYPEWINEIGTRAAQRKSCMEVVGHTGRSGSEPLNEKLSLNRAELIKTKLETAAPALRKRLLATGVGSRQNLVGNGRDDASDQLDRRVSFVVVDCNGAIGG